MHALFDLRLADATPPPGVDFFALPYPSALRLDPDGTPALAAFPHPDGFLSTYVDVIDRHARGFGPTQAVYFRFDGALDARTLPDAQATLDDDAAYLVDVTPGSAHRGEKIPLHLRFEPRAQEFIGDNWLALQPVPGAPPREGATYAAVVTDAVRGADGGDLVAPEALRRVLDGTPAGAEETRAAEVYAPLRTWLDERGLRARVAAATVYATGVGTSIMDELRTAVYATPPPALRDLARESSANLYELYVGAYDSPNFQEGDAPYLMSGGALHRGAGGKLEPVRTESLRVALTVPKGEMPPQGWPIVLYAHGTTGDYKSFVDDGTAERLAEVTHRTGGVLARFAVISIDQVLHGTRVPEGTPIEIAFFNFYNLLAARDNVKQGALDDFQLLRLVKGVDVAAAPGSGAPIRFDPSRIYFYGHSQGSTTGGLFVGAEPEVKAAIFSGAGANLVAALLTKTKPVDITAVVQSFFRDPVDPFHPFLNLLQGYFDESDCASHGRRYFLDPPAGLAPKNVFITLGLRDSYSPVETISAFAGASGVVPVKPELLPIEAMTLTGRAFVDAPQVGNVAGGVTGVVVEYDPGSRDGHFVASSVRAAQVQTARFLGTHAQTGVARLDPP